MPAQYIRYSHQKFIRQWPVEAQFDGMRADLFLTYYLKKVSRTKAQKFIREGVFSKAGKTVSPSKRLYCGEIVELKIKTPDSEDDIDGIIVDIIHEDEHLLVVNKPPLLAIHPSGPYYHCTLTYWLKNRYGPNYPRPCHRIDRETSGIVICAKTRLAQSKIKAAFRDQKVEKNYLAIVEGELKKEVEINQPLALQGKRGLVRIRMLCDPLGLPAITSFSPLYHFSATNRTLVQCRPKSGRQHQIRAHLAHIGHPILGDKLYQMGEEHFNAMTLGKDTKKPEHFRHALHAYAVEFSLFERLFYFVAPLPKDFRSLLPQSLLTTLFKKSE